MKKALSSLVIIVAAGLLCFIFFSHYHSQTRSVVGVVEKKSSNVDELIENKDSPENKLIIENVTTSIKKSKALSNSDNLQLYFFDVGQGDSAMIKKGDWEMIVDGGPDKTVLEKLGKYLSYNDRKIEVIILTHAHADHVNGLVEIIERYQVDKIYFNGSIHTSPGYEQFLKIIKEKKINTEIIEKPQEIIWDNGIHLQFLAPVKSFYQVRPEQINNSSLVFRLIYGNNNALFMGDFEEEEFLINLYSSSTLKSQLLKVGHHGSSNANSKEFLSIVSPIFAVISCGKNNKFNHPHYRTLYNLQQINAQILRTDLLGDIFFIASTTGFQQISP